jgi:DNA-binding PadR family transcriptional regulator
MMQRNPLRLTGNSYAVLALVGHLGEVTPYELKQAIEKSTENFWPVPHTTAYDEPARLAAGGYLSAQQEATGRRRKRYALTDTGREALRAWAQSPVVAPPQVRDEAMLKIFAGGDPKPLLAARRAWYELKLAELVGYLAAMADQPDGPGKRALQAGVAYHQKMLEMVEAFVDEPSSTD